VAPVPVLHRVVVSPLDSIGLVVRQCGYAMGDSLFYRFHTKVDDGLVGKQVGFQVGVVVQAPQRDLKFNRRSDEIGSIFIGVRESCNFREGIPRKGHNCSLGILFKTSHTSNDNLHVAKLQLHVPLCRLRHCLLTTRHMVWNKPCVVRRGFRGGWENA
jgi:hypothetical protein